MTVQLANYPNIVRIFNGVLLFARNIVSVDDAVLSAWDSGCIKAVFELFGAILADKSASEQGAELDTPSIQNFMATSVENEKNYEKIFITCQQFFSNLSVQVTQKSDLAVKIFKLFWNDLPAASINVWLASTSSENSIPILLLLKHLVEVSQENCGKLCESKNGQLFLQFILDHSNAWLVLKNDIYSHLLSQIITMLILNGYATVVVRKSLEGLTSLSPEQTYTFLKLLNIGIPLALEPSSPSELEGVNTTGKHSQNAKASETAQPQKSLRWSFNLEKAFFDDLDKIFEMVKNEAMPFITSAPTYEEITKKENEYHSNHLKLVTNTWYILNLLLDVFESILTVGGPNNGFEDPCLHERYSSMHEYILKETPFLDSLVDLLHKAEKHLPKRNKLKDFMDGVSPQSVNSIPAQTASDDTFNGTADDNIVDIYSNPCRHLEFPLLKAKIVFIIGILTTENKAVQDKMRETQVLEVILNNMMIDLNNPFIKENSVLTLSALLKNNAENQSIVANLKQQEAVKEEELEKAGYEINIVDGNVKVKQKVPQ